MTYRVYLIYIHMALIVFPFHPVSVQVVTDAVKNAAGKPVLLPHLAVEL